MTVRAKFKCDEVAQTTSGSKVTMSPVYSNDPNSENGKFFKWTPFGSIVMGTINPEAAAQFAPGKEFFVDFTVAE
jgi:hypothetical protein